MRSFVVRLIASLSCSVLIAGLLFSLIRHSGGDVSAADILNALKSASPGFIGIYLICQILQAMARAARAGTLLRASCRGKYATPPLSHLTLVTFVRGACVDMLPARLGELSYVAMLNRGYGVPAAECLSSMSIGLIFDFVALLGVFVAVIPAAIHGISLVGALIALALVCIFGFLGLFYVLPRLASFLRVRFFSLRLPGGFFGKIIKLFFSVADAVVCVRDGGALFKTLALSVGVRAAKYTGLYCLFLAVTAPLWPELAAAGITATLAALIAAEGAASMPVPSFMSFGTYEAGGLAALTALGFAPGISAVAMLSMHIMSQIIDYALGGVAFLIFTWMTRPAEKRTERNATSAVRVASLVALAACVVIFAAWQYRAARKRGRLTAPSVGLVSSLTPEARAQILKSGFSGRIIWSSNRGGSHDIYMLSIPDLKERRLTDSEFTDTYPRFSPDGKMVAFCRSTEKWVSQRDANRWDTWVVELESGEERCIATNAFMPAWDGDGKSLVVMRRGGEALKRVWLETGLQSDLFPRGLSPQIREGTFFTLPDICPANGAVAITLRGKTRMTAVIAQNGELERIGNGCQLVWRGKSGELAFVDSPGKMKNAIFAVKRGDERVKLFDSATTFSHEYFPRFSSDGVWLVYGASEGGHEQDSEDYEIFLYNTSLEPSMPPTRLTFYSGNDCWPDIFAD